MYRNSGCSLGLVVLVLVFTGIGAVVGLLIPNQPHLMAAGIGALVGFTLGAIIAMFFAAPPDEQAFMGCSCLADLLGSLLPGCLGCGTLLFVLAGLGLGGVWWHHHSQPANAPLFARK